MGTVLNFNDILYILEVLSSKWIVAYKLKDWF